MFVYLLILFTLLPVVELAILIRIGQTIDVGPTIGLILLTGVVGAALAKHQGLRTLSRIQAEFAGGNLPTGPMFDGLLILLAGAVLVTPGVITDAVGFALLIPPFRRFIRNRMRNHFRNRFVVIQSGGHAAGGTGPFDSDTFVDSVGHQAWDEPDRPREPLPPDHRP